MALAMALKQKICVESNSPNWAPLDPVVFVNKLVAMYDPAQKNAVQTLASGFGCQWKTTASPSWLNAWLAQRNLSSLGFGPLVRIPNPGFLESGG